MGASERHVRVFISSTFRDMQRERELLVKEVFPELRRICAGRFVAFTEVDLRWGITEEQAAEGQVLPICLEEIRLSRPYFIGLLGERYGWIPQSIAPSVLAKEPWLHEHIRQRTSVTELEILHGVLNNTQMADHAYFYFRDPAYVNSIPEQERSDFISENAEHAEKLQKLKERIRQSRMPLVEDYANPSALAAKVREDLLRLIDQLYPAPETPDPLKRESLSHESYAARKLLAYVPRPSHTAALDAFVSKESTGRGLVVTGDSGGGKTALLADWVRHRRENQKDDFVFVHYFGSTPDSASISPFLHRLLGELKHRFDLPDKIPTESDKLRESLPRWLVLTAGKGRIELVFDALNLIEGDEPDRRLAWLPRHFPPHVRALASSLPGPALDALRERGWAEHKLPLLDVVERARMIDQFFRHYRKEGEGRKLRDRITNAEGSANPLFLRTVLEELRQFGSFEQLPAKVAEYLAAPTPEELFHLVLRRWQQDFDAGRDLVRRALSLLWAARQGLSEVEWRELLGTPDEPLLHQIWSPLFLAMEPHLALRVGLHAFGHDYLRQAVQATFVAADADRQAVHAELALYFERQSSSLGGQAVAPELNRRKWSELPWQLCEARDWSKLHHVLTQMMLNPDEILPRESAPIMNEEDFWRYWTCIERDTDLRILESLRPAIDKPEDYSDAVLASVSHVLISRRHLKESRRVLTHLVEMYQCNEQAREEAATLGRMAEVCYYMHQMEDALRRLKDMEEICRRLADRRLLAGCLLQQASVLESMGRLEEALRIFEEQERVFRSLNDFAGVGACLSNRAVIAMKSGRPDMAMTLLQTCERIHLDAGDKMAYARVLYNEGIALRHLNLLPVADQAFLKSEGIFRDAGDMEGVSGCLGNRAAILEDRGRPNEAADLLAEQARICKQMDYDEGLLRAQGNLARILGLVLRRKDEAVPIAFDTLVLATKYRLPYYQQWMRTVLAEIEKR